MSQTSEFRHESGSNLGNSSKFLSPCEVSGSLPASLSGNTPISASLASPTPRLYRPQIYYLHTLEKQCTLVFEESPFFWESYDLY